MLFAIASLTLAAAVIPSAAEPTATEPAMKAELILASAVVRRQTRPLPEKLQAGQTIYAFTEVSGPGGGFVEHVWSCNGKEVARHYLPLGQSKRWRTWSRHKLTAGYYHVEVFAPDGTSLQEGSFSVLPAGEELED
jgi:hypothetical protein